MCEVDAFIADPLAPGIDSFVDVEQDKGLSKSHDVEAN